MSIKYCSPHHFVVDHPEIREAVKNKDEQLAGFLKGMIVNPERMGEVRNLVSLQSKSVCSVQVYKEY